MANGPRKPVRLTQAWAGEANWSCRAPKLLQPMMTPDHGLGSLNAYADGESAPMSLLLPYAAQK